MFPAGGGGDLATRIQTGGSKEVPTCFGEGGAGSHCNVLGAVPHGMFQGDLAISFLRPQVFATPAESPSLEDKRKCLGEGEIDTSKKICGAGSQGDSWQVRNLKTVYQAITGAGYREY